MMKLEKFELKDLQTLHVSFRTAIEAKKNQVINLPVNEFFEHTATQLNNEILMLEEQVIEIEEKMNVFKELRFSQEYMLWYFGAMKKSVQVHFLSTSEAYRVYGPYVTGLVIFDKDNKALLEDLMDKIKNSINTDGIIKFDEIVSDEMSDVVREKLKTIGFHASEIYQTLTA